MGGSDSAGVRLDVLDVHDDSPENRAALRSWLEAVQRGFHESTPGDEIFAAWLGAVRRDDARVVRGTPEPAPSVPGLPVATFTSWEGTLTVTPGRAVPLHMISDVVVSPTHRRRGLLAQMMADDLAHAVAAGRPLAALTVSEGSIYGRFGFGAATRLRQVEVEVGPRFALRQPPPDRGTFVLAQPADMIEHVEAIHDRYAAATRGAVSRPSFYRCLLSGAVDWDGGGPNRKLRGVLHLDADGVPDAHALWTHGDENGAAHVQIDDLVATSPESYLALWRFLAAMDLVTKVRWRRARVVDPLDLAVADARVVRTKELRDMLWVRVLDVAAALEARAWGADGVVVLDVADRMGHAAGRWRVAVTGATASVERSEEPVDLSLDVETLGSLYLGDVATDSLVAAGRLGGDPAALARWAAMADVGPAPSCITGF